MVNIEDPSAFEQESNVCGLEIVGKHVSPEYGGKMEEEDIDEILEWNYEHGQGHGHGSGNDLNDFDNIL